MNYARVDLHLHLDGSFYLPWAYETSLKEKVISENTTFEQYMSMLLKKEQISHEEAIAKFELTCNILQTREDLKMATWHLARMLNDQGLYYAEIRFASQQHCKKGLSQLEALQAVADGVKQARIDFPDIEIRIINCMMHKGDSALFNEKENLETIEVTRQMLGKEVVAIDLAGYENTGDFNLYAPLFKKIREYGMPCTCHAGEMGNGENVHIALGWGVDRIGHGINCVQKKEWLDEIVAKQTPMEICLSSNSGTWDYFTHPILELAKAGAKITLNTDNTMFSQTELCHEYARAACLGFSQEQLKQFTLNSIDAAFCEEEVKEKIRNKILAE